MGINCRIMLPDRIRVNDVAEVMGALTRLPVMKQFFQGQDRDWSVRVEGIKVQPSSISECCEIQWITPDNERHFVLYHFEPSEVVGRLMMPRSTAFWVAVGKRLVDFFGGELDYNDCDRKSVDYRRKRRTDCMPNDGKAWDRFQERKLKITPITDEEYADAAKHAAYGELKSSKLKKRE